MHRAFIVIDLGFGDGGKGLLTDYLVRENGARTVVRFNGGAQAGHNVVTPDGRHHTFAQIGAGSFVPGVRTHLSRFVVVHPSALLVEARRLETVGVAGALDRLTLAADAKVVTPFHQAACRLREIARGAERHGSCGVGVGEVMQDALAGHSIHVRDFADGSTLRRKLDRLREHKRAELADTIEALRESEDAADELSVLEDLRVVESWITEAGAIAARVAIVDDERAMKAILRDGTVVFEGAQGVLLDEWRGFHPHTTWSTCTPENALALLGDGYDGRVERIGVLRTYATRHGAGPFPTEDSGLGNVLKDPNNVTGPWQGAFRFGWLDLVLLRYAIDACRGIDSLALTHLDALPSKERWRLAHAYCDVRGPMFVRQGELATAINLGPHQDLEYQAALTRALFSALPVYREIDADPRLLIDSLSAELKVPVALTSAGPSSRDVRRTASFDSAERATPSTL